MLDSGRVVGDGDISQLSDELVRKHITILSESEVLGVIKR
jgi:hypothetical protein